MTYRRFSDIDNDSIEDRIQEMTNIESKERSHIGFEGIREKKPTFDDEGIQLVTAEKPEIRPRLNTAERKVQEETLCFEDNVRRIDFILTYTITEKTQDKKHSDGCDRMKKREAFLKNFDEHGLEYEIQDCSESPDQVTWFVKVHARWGALLEGAERLGLRMPFADSKLRKSSWRECLFDLIKVEDPLLPKIAKKYEIQHHLTTPFCLENKENFTGISDQDTFFSSAQRSAIVYDILQHIQYGEDADQVGIAQLLCNNSFTGAFPLHDGPYTCSGGEEIDNERQLLYYHWSKWTNFYKSQPLNHVRKYFGEKVGIYFTWVGFYTEWLMYAAFVGCIVMLYGFSTIPTHRNAIADDICNTKREHFFMCPLCDEKCDFWYLRDTCNAARAFFLFDNAATVFFAAFMALWAVLFLEFWKRRQFVLQHDWDVLGYEEVEERPRPQFEQEIERKIKKLQHIGRGENIKKYKQFNPVYEKDEIIQPDSEYLPKIGTAFSVLCSMVLIVIGIVFAVLLYRLAVAGALYRAVQKTSAADFIALFTGSLIQLVAILIMNKRIPILIDTFFSSAVTDH